VKLFRRRRSDVIAEERLKFILVQDRSLLTPAEFERMKEDIIRVISNYFEINKSGIELNIQRENRKTILEATVPVISVKRSST